MEGDGGTVYETLISGESNVSFSVVVCGARFSCNWVASSNHASGTFKFINYIFLIN